MDFAAQLAKLERQAVNAAKKNTATQPTNQGITTTATGTYGEVSAPVSNGDLDPRRRQRDQSPYHNRNNGGENSTAGFGEDRSIRRRYDNNYRNNHRGGGGGGGGGGNQYHHHQSRRFSPSNANNKNPFQELQQSGYRIRPSLPWVPKSDRTKPHICLLAIIIDELPYEHIWRAWADHCARRSNNHCYVSLVCHAKYPKRVQSQWVRQRLLVQPPQIGRGGSVTGNHTTFSDPMYHTHVPEWGSIQIARAMIDCLKDGVLIGTKKASEMNDERFTPNRYVISPPPPVSSITTLHHPPGMNDDATARTIPTVDKFIFISESCLPVMTLDEYVQILFPILDGTATTDATTIQDRAPSNDNNANHIHNTNVHDNDDEDHHIPSSNNDVASNVTNDVESKVSAVVEATVIAATTELPTKTEEEVEVVNTPIDPWDVSWVNGRSRNSDGTPRNMYENYQFQHIDARIPDTCRYKADQWILLSRRHAIHILHIDEHISHPQYQFWTLFQKISASDEMYFPTTLGILGLLKDEDSQKNTTNAATNSNTSTISQQLTSPILKRSVTYTDWSQGMRNPTSFTNGIGDFETVAHLAREQQCLLARKFVVVQPSIPNDDGDPNHMCKGQITVDEWMGAVHKLSGKN